MLVGFTLNPSWRTLVARVSPGRRWWSTSLVEHTQLGPSCRSWNRNRDCFYVQFVFGWKVWLLEPYHLEVFTLSLKPPIRWPDPKVRKKESWKKLPQWVSKAHPVQLWSFRAVTTNCCLSLGSELVASHALAEHFSVCSWEDTPSCYFYFADEETQVTEEVANPV